MFSKTPLFRSFVAGVFASLSLLGCSKYLNESKDNSQGLNQDAGNFACVKELPPQLSKFVKGEILPAEVNQGVDCAKNTLIYFSENTTGSLPDAYAPEDLRRFVGKYFLKENNFSPSLVSELFKLKKLFLGGSSSALTKLEIQKLVEISEKLKTPLALLSPHLPRLLTLASSATFEELQAGIDQWSKTLLIIASNAELMSSQYTFQDLKTFLAELNLFLKDRPLSGLAKKVDENSALIESAKNIFMGEVAQFSSVRDWNQAISSVTGLHLQFLRYHYFVSAPGKHPQERLKALSLMIDGGFELVRESLAMKQQSKILFTDIDRLLDILDSKKLLPFGVSVLAAKNLYKTIILRTLDSHRRMQDARDFEALERSHFMALHHEWRVFKLHQTFIDALPFDSADSVTVQALREAAQKDGLIQETIKSLSKESLEQKRLWTAWLEGRELLLQQFPVVTDSGGRMLMEPRVGLRSRSRTSLASWNLVRGMTRMMLRGYGSKTSPDVFKTTIQVEGLELWYADFKEVGIEIKAFDPRNLNSGARSFKEANFFTYHGDGNDLMTSTETFEFVALLISAGMGSSTNLRNHMSRQGCALSFADVLGYPLLDEACFKNQLRQSIAKEFSNLPMLVKEVQKMNSKTWDEFYQNLMAGGRVSPAASGRIETADLRAAVMILHYIEALMSVYDKDGNGTLNAQELNQAAPRFLGFMAKASPQFVRTFKEFFPNTGNSLVADFFSYLVYRGEKPGGKFFDYAVTFQKEKKRGSLGEVSRDKIVRVFKILKDEAAGK